MKDRNLLNKIFELRGIIKSMNMLASHDGDYDNPFIDELEQKMNEIVEIVQEKELQL
ncbi:hypothetical protein [Cytobacillus gottheilii]|uniref:hypothetical protein n=1 Tax=Cytobacillus gottheilii TaxID=859144 RepID=UPI0024943ED2|nr:hypothetical protein [Cytobacillus gottheilii]